MSDIIPVLNSASSSLKFSIFEIVGEQSLALPITGQIEGLGRSPRFVAKNEKGDLQASSDPNAREAIDFFVYRASQGLGAMATAMGVELDEAANDAGGPRISTADSPDSAWVIPTDEEKIMALHTLGLISK